MKRKKIIILTSRFPFPLDKGDKLRIYHQIKHMSEYHDLYLISINTEKAIKKAQINELEKHCKKVIVFQLSFFTRIYNLIISFIKGEPLQVGYFYSKRVHQKIQSKIKKIKPDWIYSQLIRTAKYVDENENNIIDYMDAFSKGIERRIKTFPLLLRPIIKRESYVTKKYESKIFNSFKTHTIITENDRRFINHIDRQKIKIIANGVDTQYFKYNKKEKKYDFVFVGNMSYPPNIEAAIYLCKKVLPIIVEKHKECKVLIAGTNPHYDVQKLQNDNIIVSGWVDDIRNTYSSGKIFVAPMFIGTGLQNKLLEAMSMGLPCVTTKLANNALGANSSQIILADNAQEFANACIKLLTNKKLAKNLQSEGLKFVQKKYDWKKINYNLSSLFK